MALLAQTEWRRSPARCASQSGAASELPDLGEAEALLLELASVFSAHGECCRLHVSATIRDAHASNLEAKYRALLEQIPAVVFMAYLDRGVSEAYVSPEIEAALGILPRRMAGRSGPLV